MNRLSQPTWDADLMFVNCWSTVYDAGPTSNQHCISISCLLAYISHWLSRSLRGLRYRFVQRHSVYSILVKRYPYLSCKWRKNWTSCCFNVGPLTLTQHGVNVFSLSTNRTASNISAFLRLPRGSVDNLFTYQNFIIYTGCTYIISKYSTF